jgi:hypothetical protein
MYTRWYLIDRSIKQSLVFGCSPSSRAASRRVRHSSRHPKPARATRTRASTHVSRVNPILNTHTQSSAPQKSEIQHPEENLRFRLFPESKSALYAQTVTFPRNQPPPRTPASLSIRTGTDRSIDRRRRRARRATRPWARRDAKNKTNKKSHARLPMRRLPIPRRNVNRRRSSESTTVDRILLLLVLLPRPRSPTDGVVEVVV